METRLKLPAKLTAPSAGERFTRRSAAIISRGLRDLARDSNWVVNKAFSGTATHLSISRTGLVCLTEPPGVPGGEMLIVRNIQQSAPPISLRLPQQPGLRIGDAL